MTAADSEPSADPEQIEERAEDVEGSKERKPPSATRAAPRPSPPPAPPASDDLSTADPEVVAIHRILSVLAGLDIAGRTRVIEFILGRTGHRPSRAAAPADSTRPTLPGSAPAADSPSFRVPAESRTDIKSLREEKQPGSLNEMATLVAFYLKEVAVGDEHRDTVTAADLEKYFRQAGYKLPTRAIMALVNARQAGYLDPTGDAGVYKLNPVGYNLVAHSMPTGRRTTHTRSRAISKPRHKGKP